MERTTVINSYGQTIDFEAAVNAMDFNLCEKVHREGDQSPQAFFNNYCKAHFEKFGEVFDPDKKNPVW